MTPKKKFVFLVFATVSPYAALVMYFAFPRQNHAGQIPEWLPYFGLSYMLAAMIVGAIVSRRVFRDAPKLPETKTQSVLARVAELWALYLVLVWSGLFIYGVRDVIIGVLPLRRAIPAGAFLLAFIGLFSWSLFRSYGARKYPTEPQ
jgi:hypothetical protein